MGTGIERGTRQPSPESTRPWILRPWVLASEVCLALAICVIVVLRVLVHLASYDGPSYSVRQVSLERGFIAWEGEHTAVRGQVLTELTGCGRPVLKLADPGDGLHGPFLVVAFEPQPHWLWQLSRLPGMSVLLPSGVPPHPQGNWTVTGHLTLGWDQTCLPNYGYVLVADTYQ